nr:RNA-directed DNA polymerase, eukaryota [Tanacetum cinerariifolium]
MPLRVRFPRIYALDFVKEVSVEAKFGDPSLDDSFRRQVKDGSERQQWLDLVSMLDVVSLSSSSSSSNRWYYDFSGDGAFSVKEVRSNLDDVFLPSSDVVTRWVRYVPIKINVFTWRARLDRLPTRDAQSFDDWLSWFKSVRMPGAPSSSTILFRLLLIGVSIDVIVHFLGSSG